MAKANDIENKKYICMYIYIILHYNDHVSIHGVTASRVMTTEILNRRLGPN